MDVNDGYSFEMDQDYSFTGGLNVHDSAPSCHGMKDAYTNNHNDPGWDWQPSACYEIPVSGFSGNHFRPGATRIKAAHITELRERINAQRLRFSLAAFAWTDAAIIPGVTPVRRVHLTELRTALSEAYVAAGRDRPAYTDSSIVAGVTPIRAVHVSELQEAVIALEIELFE